MTTEPGRVEEARKVFDGAMALYLDYLLRNRERADADTKASQALSDAQVKRDREVGVENTRHQTAIGKIEGALETVRQASGEAVSSAVEREREARAAFEAYLNEHGLPLTMWERPMVGGRVNL